MNNETSLSGIQQALNRIESDLDSGTYKVGGWQKCLGKIKKLGPDAIPWLREDLTRISNKLHRRNQFPEAPAWAGFLFEYLLFAASLVMMGSESVAVRLAAIVLLALCLQPLIKISVGMLLGVRYAYVYLWYFEPRFKMKYGSYQGLDKSKKLALQFSGSVGTPVALLVGWQVLGDENVLSLLCLAGALVATLMQLSAFIAAWLGVRTVGPFLLSNLTTPALLAQEMRDAPAKQQKTGAS